MKKIIFLLFIAFLDAISIKYASALTLSDNKKIIELGYYYSYFEDTERSHKIQDVFSVSASSLFKKSDVREPNFGYSNAALWIKVDIENIIPHETTWFIEIPFPTLDEIDVYLFDRDSGDMLLHSTAGDLRPFNERPYPHRNFVFPLTLPPLKNLQIIIRVDSRGSLTVTSFLWPPELFHRYTERSYIAFSLYFGILFALFAYNLLLYISLRDISYLYYVFFVSFLALAQFSWNGLGYQFLWPDYPRWGNISSIVGFDAAGMFGAIFTRIFLQTRKNNPLLDKAIVVCAAAFASLLIATLVAPYTSSAIATSLTGVVFGSIATAAGIVCLMKGFSSARYFVLAWTMLLLGTVMLGARNLAWIPTNFYTSHSMLIGSAFEMILLSFALADRINIMRTEKEATQHAYSKTLEKTKYELEEKVAIRTVELSEVKERAEAATRLKDQFISLVSHDIRSPLIAIKGMIDGFEGNKLASMQKTVLREISITIEGLLNFVQKLLDISRLKTGNIKLKMQFVDIYDLVHTMTTNILFTAGRKQITIQNKLPYGLKIFCDPVLFGEVILNLLTNAIKFCKGGDTITIYMPEGHHSTIAVRDSGPGIPDKFLPNLFKHEIKTISIGSDGEIGTGLGLPHCYDIMKAHRGTIKVESHEGKGAVFFTALPEVEKVILIVDGQEAHREIMKEQLYNSLTKIGFMEAENGIEALGSLKLTRPDLIITDIAMSEMDGIEFIRILRNTPEYFSIPLLVATVGFDDRGRAIENLREKMLSIGADGFVLKPTSAENFMLEIKNFISFFPFFKTRVITNEKLLPQSYIMLDKKYLNILLAEDNYYNQKLIADSMKQYGHTVNIAKNGREAVLMWQKGNYDLILMDIQMPEMSGIDATEEIRKIEKQKGGHIPIIAVTANVFQEEMDRCLKVGMDDFITKPVNIDKLLLKLYGESLPTSPSTHLYIVAGEGSSLKNLFDFSTMPKAMDKEEVLIEYVRLLMDDLQKGIYKIKEAINRKDNQMVERAAHTVKGTSAPIKNNSINRIAGEIEIMGREGNTEGIGEKLSLLKSEYEKIYDIVKGCL